MRIMTTRKLCFYSKDRKEKFETSGNRIIETCPAWAKEDDMFKAAVRAGILTCLMDMSSKEEVKVQEAAPSNAHEEKKLAEELAAPVEAEVAPVKKSKKKA